MWILALIACSRSLEPSPHDRNTPVEPLVDCNGATTSPREVPYDGIDQDCSGDDLVDVDKDGEAADFVGGTDCDDQDETIGADARDIAYDGIDQDCDGANVTDYDQDGFDAVQVGGDDCDDREARTHPGAVDFYGDHKDEDCSGADGTDADGDGWAWNNAGGEDCDDQDPAIHPDATEIWYDDIDQDCDYGCDHDQDGDGAIPVGAVVADQSACDSDPVAGSVGAGEDCDDLDPAVITNAVIDSEPELYEVGFAGEDPVVVTLAQADAGAIVTVIDGSGIAVPGTTTVDGATLTFIPVAPLAPDASYEVEVTHVCGVETWSFVTAPAIGPVDPTTLVGRVWSLSAAEATWTGDPVIGEFVADEVDRGWFVAVLATDGAALDLRIARTDGVLQDPCVPTVDVLGVPLDTNPVISWTVDLTASGDGGVVPLYAVTVTGTIRGDRFTDVTAAGQADTRGVDIGWDICGVLLPIFARACVACPDGELQCLDGGFTDFDGYGTTAVVVEKTVAEVEADPSCL